MNNELTEFNNKVIETMKEQNEKEGILVLDPSNPSIAVTKIDINNIPSLVFVKLEDEVEDDSRSLTERIETILLVISISDLDTYKKMANWMALIHNELQSSLILNQDLDKLV